MNPISRFALLGLSMALAACSLLEPDRIDYKSAGKGPSLTVLQPRRSRSSPSPTRSSVTISAS